MSIEESKCVPCELLHDDPAAFGDCVLLDVRTPAEHGEAWIEGSVNVPLHDLGKRADEVAERCNGRDLVLVCRSGNRAEMARQKLVALGLTEARVLEGGIQRWEAVGNPLNRGKSTISIERQVRIAAGALVVLGSLLGALVHPGFLALAGFVGAGLVFAGVTDRCGMALVLARLPFNRARRPAGEEPRAAGAAGR